MPEEQSRAIYVIGHKNPDTDSVCSAIAYANLKRITTGEVYEAKRAGHLNEETQYVLNRFGAKKPEYLRTVRSRVSDADIHKMPGIERRESLKIAWDVMRSNHSRSVPVLDAGRLIGMLSITDIAQSYMDVHDANMLSNAKTSYDSIAQTLDGEIVCKGPDEIFAKGKVAVAASSPEKMEEFIKQDDLVILGNRYEAQLCSLELGASCLVLCQGSKPAKTIIRMAEEKNCVVISTAHDTFTAARLITQSIPVEYFMSSENLVTFRLTDFADEIQDTATKYRYRNFPVIDEQGMYVGLVSRRRLMQINKKRLILLDHNEKSQAVDGIEQAEILEIIDHHRLGGFETISPVYFRNQPVGCTATIVAQMYHEADVPMDKTNAALLCAAIISDTIMLRSPTCTDTDRETCKELAGIAGIDMNELGKEMFKAGSNLKGKSPKEICMQDFKRFTVGSMEFGVGQINSMSEEELDDIKRVLQPYLQELLKEQKLQMVFIMLTNIMDVSTELLFAGGNAEKLLHEVFNIPAEDKDIYLKGIVSRKKQLLPAIVEALQ